MSPPMDSEARFRDALARVKALPQQPSNVLLDLYGLFKQASDGDVSGKRPGVLDLRGRAKWDAWAARQGMTREAAMLAYAELVDRLCGGGATP